MRLARRGFLGLAFAAALCAAPAQAQGTPAAARPADVETLDGIVAALYDVISGPVGQKRDWDRMRSLFLPGARLIPTGPDPAGGHRARVLTVEDYITQVGPNLERMGFRESEIARKTDRFGNIAQLFSSYAGTTAGEPDKPLRGINSIQAVNDGRRWWIVSVFWQAEGPGAPIPAEYLRGG